MSEVLCCLEHGKGHHSDHTCEHHLADKCKIFPGDKMSRTRTKIRRNMLVFPLSFLRKRYPEYGGMGGASAVQTFAEIAGKGHHSCWLLIRPRRLCRALGLYKHIVVGLWLCVKCSSSCDCQTHTIAMRYAYFDSKRVEAIVNLSLRALTCDHKC